MDRGHEENMTKLIIQVHFLDSLKNYKAVNACLKIFKNSVKQNLTVFIFFKTIKFKKSDTKLSNSPL